MGQTNKRIKNTALTLLLGYVGSAKGVSLACSLRPSLGTPSAKSAHGELLIATKRGEKIT